MLDITTIKSLSLIREIRQPKSESEKFHNSDKPWNEALLGKNFKAILAAFSAIQLASNPPAKISS